MRTAFDQGIRFFDTADAYSSGWSERVLGRTFGDADGLCVATKVGYSFRPRSRAEHLARSLAGRLRDHRGDTTDTIAASPAPPAPRVTRAYAAQQFEADALVRRAIDSAARLHRKPLDLLQLHDPPLGLAASAASIVGDLKGSGVCRQVGVATGDLEVATEWLGTGLVDSIQVPFGVLDPEALPLIATASRDVLVIVRGIFGGGTLGRSNQASAARCELIAALDALAEDCAVTRFQIAAWYVRSAAPQCVWLVGASTRAQVIENAQLFATPLPSAEIGARLLSLGQGRAEPGGRS